LRTFVLYISAFTPLSRQRLPRPPPPLRPPLLTPLRTHRREGVYISTRTLEHTHTIKITNPHRATHGQGEATSWHRHRRQHALLQVYFTNNSRSERRLGGLDNILSLAPACYSFKSNVVAHNYHRNKETQPYHWRTRTQYTTQVTRLLPTQYTTQVTRLPHTGAC